MADPATDQDGPGASASIESNTERSGDFLVDEHAMPRMSNFANSQPASSSSTDAMLNATSAAAAKPKVEASAASEGKQQATAPSDESKGLLVAQLSTELQCDPSLSAIASQQSTLAVGADAGRTNGKSSPSKGKQTTSDIVIKKAECNNKSKEKEASQKAAKAEETKQPSAAAVKNEKALDNETTEDFPALALLHDQCDPCLVGMMVATTKGRAASSSMGAKDVAEKAALLSVLRKTKTTQSKTKGSNVKPCSTTSNPATYLEVEPLMSQLVPKGVADAINLELSKSSLGAEELPPAAAEAEDDGTQAPDWQTLPKNLLGKVAFFEKIMHQKQQEPTPVDPTVKVKAEVSEKVKTAHVQVRTSLLATKAPANGGSGVVLPDDITPLAVKKERVQTFFPKDETAAATVPASKTQQPSAASKWDKVETVLPSTFEDPKAEDTPSKSQQPESSPAPNVDDMVTAMEKSLDDELDSLRNEFSNFDSKANDLNSKLSANAETTGGSFDHEEGESTTASTEEPEPTINNGHLGPIEKDAPGDSEDAVVDAVEVKPSPEIVEEEPVSKPVSNDDGSAAEEDGTGDAEQPVFGEGDETGAGAVDPVEATKSEEPCAPETNGVSTVDPAILSRDLAVPEALKTEEREHGAKEQTGEESIDPMVVTGNLASVEGLKTAESAQETTEPVQVIDQMAVTGELAATEGLKTVESVQETTEPAEESVDRMVVTCDLVATEVLNTVESAQETTEPAEESVDPMVVMDGLAVTEAVKTEVGTEAAELAMIEPVSSPEDLTTAKATTKEVPAEPENIAAALDLSRNLLSSETPKDDTLAGFGGLEAAFSAEEVLGESLSRDIATEVLQADEASEDASASDDAIPSIVASLSIDEFPSLASTTPKSPKRSPGRRQLKKQKSYAQVLAEGKKLELDKPIDLSKYIVPPSPPAATVVTKKEIQDTADDEKQGDSAVDNTDKEKAETPDPQIHNATEDKTAAQQSSASAPDDADRHRIEEIAHRLAEASPQKQIETSVEESKEELPANPGFTSILRESKRKITSEDVSEERRLRPGISNEMVLPNTSSSLSQANFNPYDVLTVDELASTTRSKKGKSKKSKGAKNNKSALQPASPTKSVQFGGGTGNTTQSKGKAGMAPPKSSTPLLALPLHLFNNLVHMRPISYLFDGVFWCLVLLVGGPLAAAGLILLTIYRLATWLARLFGFGIIDPKKNPDQQLAVVITGCDSGFGRDLAVALMHEGFVVFCGCLLKESLKDFKNEKLAVPIQIDITKDKDVDKAAKTVMDWLAEDDGRYLHALVNNAGVGTPGLIDWVPLADFQKMIDVNYIGMVRCCKTFLPLFKFQACQEIYSDARIVNMVSIAGVVSGGLFSVGYEASKHAADAFTTNLRLETKGFGLKVTAINPSFHRTPLTRSMSDNIKKVWNALSPQKQKEYGEDHLKEACESSDVAQKFINWDSRNVIHAMQRSLTDKNPPARILVGGDARYALILGRMLPTWFLSRMLERNTRKVAMMEKKQ